MAGKILQGAVAGAMAEAVKRLYGFELQFGAFAVAQQALNLERDCKVLRTCNFTRNGQPRGCLSSYTCRTCKMVPVKCNIGGRTKCQEFVCSWGG